MIDKIKKAIKLNKANRQLDKKSSKASNDLTSAIVLKWLKGVFDPYTSKVYDELMDEKQAEAIMTLMAVEMARKEIKNIINEQ